MQPLIALLGRRDEPTDGVADYCNYLGRAMATHGFEMKYAHLSWNKDGWLQSLWKLVRDSKAWNGTWVLLQYTALAWSRRGFPLGIVLSLAILRLRGARCGVVFHEPAAVGPTRLLGRFRCGYQNLVIRTLHHFSRKSFFTVPLNTVSWLPSGDLHSTFVPLGPNIPENLTSRSHTRNSTHASKTVVVFCVSESPYGEREIKDIAFAMRIAASGGTKLRAVFVGRGTLELKSVIDRSFSETQIEVSNRGVCDADEVSRIFSEADAMLAVRGRLYLRRGSVLAGLACGLPIVAYGGAATERIIEEAGITLVPFGDCQALGSAVRDIVSNDALWQEMHKRSVYVQQKYLSWNVIAAEFARVLNARESLNENPTVF
jgi:glycosyltransferase involved in cell wall biosynthesis